MMKMSWVPITVLSVVIACTLFSLTAQLGIASKQSELISAQDRAIAALKSQVEAQNRELAASADLTNAHRGLLAEYRKAVAIRDEALERR